MRHYAQPEDLVPEWLDTAPANARSLIRHASTLVDKATRLARYDVDSDGYPTDEPVATALRNAVCQQVTIWHKANLDPDLGATGQTPHLTGQNAGAGSISYSGAQTTQELGQAATTLADATLAILSTAGLTGGKVVRRR